MSKASDFDKSKFFKGTDLDREKKFRVRDVTEETLPDGKGKTERKLVVWFTSAEQGLVLNKTNLRALQGAFGDDTAGWADNVIAIFPMMAGNGKPGLRVRILPPKQAAASPKAAPAVDPALEEDPA